MLFRLEVVNGEQIKMIDRTSRDILIEVGVKIPNKRILDILYDYGARMDKSENVVRFSEDIIVEGLKGISGSFSLYGRDLNNVADFSEGNFNSQSMAGQYVIVDILNAKRSSPKLDDMINGIRLGELLENINIVGAFVVPQDVDVKVRDIMSAYYLLGNTKKQ